MTFHETPFRSTKPVEASEFVDRDHELSVIQKCLLFQGNNVNLFGAPGIGKSSVLRKLQADIATHYKDVLVVHLYLMSFVKSSGTDLARFFLLSVADEMWSRLFKKSYSELLEYLSKPDPASALFNQSMRSFLRIYRLLRSGTISSNIEESSELKGQLLLGAKTGEKYSTQFRIENLFQFEFARLLSELVLILEEHNMRRIVILADEANYLHEDEGKDLLGRNFDILLDPRIRYVFVTLEASKVGLYEADKIFQYQIPLGPFPDIGILHTLINAYCASFVRMGKEPLQFSEASKNTIWELSKGHPKIIQRACELSWISAAETKSRTIDEQNVLSVLSQIEAMPN
jgi:hypothetical protein